MYFYLEDKSGENGKFYILNFSLEYLRAAFKKSNILGASCDKYMRSIKNFQGVWKTEIGSIYRYIHNNRKIITKKNK